MTRQDVRWVVQVQRRRRRVVSDEQNPFGDVKHPFHRGREEIMPDALRVLDELRVDDEGE